MGTLIKVLLQVILQTCIGISGSKCVQCKGTHLSTMFLDFRIRLTSPAVAGP